jgi:peroxiredoxin
VSCTAPAFFSHDDSSYFVTRVNRVIIGSAMTGGTSNPRDRFTLFLGLACAALAILTLLLAWQNRSLKAQLSASASAPPAGGLKVGDTLHAFDVVDASGNKTPVTFEGPGQTLLLVFSSTCGACRETIPVWNRLLADGVPKTVHVVGIQTDFQHGAEADATVPIPDLRFPVFGSAEPRGEAMSKFPAIPAAAIIDDKGAVKSVWFGVPSESQVAELRRALAG